MKKTCKYCGVVPLDHVCPHAKKRTSRHTRSEDGSIEAFRSSALWQRKRGSIKARDLYLCRYCLVIRGRANPNKLEVHHIEPLAERFDLRLDDDNLITMCDTDHKLADAGKISKDELRKCIPPG